MSSALYPLVPPFVAVVILLARLLMDFGYKLGLEDQPNERSSHIAVVPRVGGLAIFVPYLILGLCSYLFGYNYVEFESYGTSAVRDQLAQKIDFSSNENELPPQKPIN